MYTPVTRCDASKSTVYSPAAFFSFNNVATFLPSKSKTSNVTYDSIGREYDNLVVGLNGLAALRQFHNDKMAGSGITAIKGHD